MIPEDTLKRLKATRDPKVYAREFECDFSADIPGAIYAAEMEEALRAGRVLDFNPSTSGVYSTWDLGSPENTAVVYWQVEGPRRSVIDTDLGLNVTLEERVAHMMSKGYKYAGHLLPHDSAAKQPNGLTFAEEARKAGLQNVMTIPRTADVQIRINATKKSFSNIWFREGKTQHLRDALSQYHYKESTDGTGWITNKIHHGWESHPSDAFGMMAEAELHGMLSPQQASTKRWRKPKVIGGAGY